MDSKYTVNPEYQKQMEDLRKENEYLRATIETLKQNKPRQESYDDSFSKFVYEDILNMDILNMEMFKTGVLKLCKVINTLSNTISQRESDDIIIPDNFILYAHADKILTSAAMGETVLMALLAIAIETADLGTNIDATHASENLRDIINYYHGQGRRIRDIAIRMPPTVPPQPSQHSSTR